MQKFLDHPVQKIRFKLTWYFHKIAYICHIPLSANPTWSNTLKQFVGRLLTNCLSVFYRFVWLALKGLNTKSYAPATLLRSPAVRNTSMVSPFCKFRKTGFQSRGRGCLSCYDCVKTCLIPYYKTARSSLLQYFNFDLFILRVKNCHVAKPATERCCTKTSYKLAVLLFLSLLLIIIFENYI